MLQWLWFHETFRVHSVNIWGWLDLLQLTWDDDAMQLHDTQTLQSDSASDATQKHNPANVGMDHSHQAQLFHNKHYTIKHASHITKVKVAHTRLPSIEFQSWSRFLAISLQVTWVIKPAVGCNYFPPGSQLPLQHLRGLLPILLLGKHNHDRCEQFA